MRAASEGITVNVDDTIPVVPHLLTLDEAAAHLRTPIGTLRYWRHLGIGPRGFRVGRRVMFRREDLEQWLTEQREAGRLRR